MKLTSIITLALCVAGSSLAAVAAEKAASTKPNIILILSDDVGLGDVGCTGGHFKTPHIDSLAKGGTGMQTLIADGENLSRPEQFQAYLRPRRLIDVLQLDIRRGGFLGNREAARLGAPERRFAHASHRCQVEWHFGGDGERKCGMHHTKLTRVGKRRNVKI